MNPTGRLSFNLVAAACLATGFTACETPARDAYFAEAAQSSTSVDLKPGASGRTGAAVEGSGRPEGIGRVGKYFYYIRDGAATRLYQRQRFAQGYSVDRNGQVISRDGNVVVLHNNEMVTFAGERMTIPPGVNFPSN